LAQSAESHCTGKLTHAARHFKYIITAEQDGYIKLREETTVMEISRNK
jgi:hypothetical protein